MNIDLSTFNNIDLNEENYTSTFRMQKVNQLQVSIDSLERDFREQKRVFSDNFNKKHYASQIKTVKIQEYEPDSLITANLLNIVENKTKWRRRQSINNAITDVKSILRSLENKKRTFFIYQKLINLHKITLFDRFTIIFACIFLFLIGASLGAIIKKGGLGLPMVLSVLIFLSYHYIGIFGKNAAEDNSITPYLASWISTIIIAPFAFYLTRRASYDEGFINLDFLFIPLKHFFKKISSSK
jgi:lipopolysaccharide export system permease protein